MPATFIERARKTFVVALLCASSTGFAADVLEPLSRNAIRGAFLEYSPQPEGVQLPMPSVVWQGVIPNPLIREGAMVFLAKVSEKQIKEFEVVPDPTSAEYLYLHVLLVEDGFREIPIRAHPAEAFWSEGDVSGFIEWADFRVDSLTDFQPRLYKGIYTIGEGAWFQTCGSTMTNYLRPRDSNVSALLENAERKAKADSILSEARSIYLEIEARRLGQFIGESLSGADSLLLVSRVIGSRNHDACAEN